MSKIEIHHSLIVARKVVRALEKILPKEIAKECRIESWSNGREQGLCINYVNLYLGEINKITKAMKVVVAECRNSDSILVVHGNGSDFDYQTNQPNEEAYFKNRKYFNCENYDGAAEHIKGVLK